MVMFMSGKKVCSACVLLAMLFFVSTATARMATRPVPGAIDDRVVESPELPAPEEPDGAVIESVRLDARITNQVAEVAYEVIIRNPTDETVDTEYLFPLPHSGAVQDMRLEVDGKRVPGRLLPKDEAREVYERLARERKDPGLVEYVGRGLFRASVASIPPGKSRKVSLFTTSVCERTQGVVEFAFPLAPHGSRAREIDELKIKVFIDTEEQIKSIYSPSHDVTTERFGNLQAEAVCKAENIRPDRDFRLFYGMDEGFVGGNVLSCRPSDDRDGYFMLMASPEVTEDPDPEAKQKKTVIFTIDRSGSMRRNNKMEQARRAAKHIIKNLNEKDLFNIVVYDGDIEVYSPELIEVTPETRAEALKYVAGLSAGGMTDIDGALKKSLEILEGNPGPAYVLFMTDGRPTQGVRDEDEIVENVGKRNKTDARIYSFGVGYDVNARLLDRISGNNKGYAEYVTPEEDFEFVIARFYGNMTAPVMTDVELRVNPAVTNLTYPDRIPDIFAGGQVIVFGRYSKSGPATFIIEGYRGEEKVSMEINADLADTAGGYYDSAHGFIANIWAQRRVGAILQQIDREGRTDALIEELVNLSERYGILTPYTSFLADDDFADAPAAMDKEIVRERADGDLLAMAETGGRSGVWQRRTNHGLRSSERVSDHRRGYSTGGEARRVENLRQVGGNSFFRRGEEWVQTDLLQMDLGEEEIKEVQRYSDLYFELASTAPGGRSLAQSGTVVVRLGEQLYRVVD